MRLENDDSIVNVKLNTQCFTNKIVASVCSAEIPPFWSTDDMISEQPVPLDLSIRKLKDQNGKFDIRSKNEALFVALLSPTLNAFFKPSAEGVPVYFSPC